MVALCLDLISNNDIENELQRKKRVENGDCGNNIGVN